MKKILMSLLTIGLVSAVAFGATRALFSDTETSVDNTFTAGTIDISVDDENSWERTEPFALTDMKPCYTDYINFTIKNVGSNPANIWKKLGSIVTEDNIQSEPECVEGGADWDASSESCTGGTYTPKHDVQYYINYDLLVEVYDAANAKVWWQAIYVDSDDVTVAEIAAMADGVYLGMLPVGYTMKVTQSYHMIDSVTNWAQGDEMSFDISLEAEQLTGVAWLENKTDAPDYKIVYGDGFEGTLTYEVKHPTFAFTFTGKAPMGGEEYTLLRAVDPWPQTGSTVLGTGTSDGSGDITITGDLDTGDMKDAKVWLVLSDDWNGTQFTGWQQTRYLLETGLIWYEDTDL